MANSMLPCFKCGKTLDQVFGSKGASANQPSEATVFDSEGQYGSTYFDPMDGQRIEINICDECLKDYPNRIAWYRAFAPIQVDGVLVGREWLRRPLLLVQDAFPNGLVYDNEDTTRHIEVEDLGKPWPNVEWRTDRFEFAREVVASLDKKEEEDKS